MITTYDEISYFTINIDRKLTYNFQKNIIRSSSERVAHNLWLRESENQWLCATSSEDFSYLDFLFRLYLETFGSSTLLINLSKGTFFFFNASNPPPSFKLAPASKIWSKRYCNIFCTTKFDGLSFRNVFHG